MNQHFQTFKMVEQFSLKTVFIQLHCLLILLICNTTLFAHPSKMDEKIALNEEIKSTILATIKVNSTSPVANSKEIERNSSIAITFDGNLNSATVNSTNIKVWGKTVGTIAGTWSVNGATATFDPTQDLATGEVIHVEVTPSVLGANGDVAEAFKYAFTTDYSKNEDLGLNWKLATTLEGTSWRNIAYGNGRYVAVGSNGTNRVAYSSDGKTWTLIPAVEQNSWNSVTYGDGKFVAVSLDGTNQVMYSTDGQTWTSASIAGGPYYLSSIAYGNGRFVAVSQTVNNGVFYSSDGINWTNANVTIFGSWGSVVYGNGRFVATAIDAPKQVMYSDDGVAWTDAATGIGTGGDTDWVAVAYGNGRFVSVAYSGAIRAMFSANGESWTPVTLLNELSSVKWRHVTFGNGLFVAVPSDDSDILMYSEDGQNWASSVLPIKKYWKSIVYGDGRFIALDEKGSIVYRDRPFLLNSTTPSSNATNVATNSTINLAFNSNVDASSINGNTVQIRGQQSGVIAGSLSINGSNVTFTPTNDFKAGEVIHVDVDSTVSNTETPKLDLFEAKHISFTVAAQENATLGSNWKSASASNVSEWNSVTYGNGRYVAVTKTGTNRAMYSDDGLTWTNATGMDNSSVWTSVTYGNNRFVAVAENGTNRVMYSDDGMSWTATTASELNQWESVVYGKGRYVAVAKSGTNRVMYSSDGATWTSKAATEASLWYSVNYGNGRFVAVSNNGTNRVMYSEDGETWTATSATEANSWHSITYGNGKFVAVAKSGTNRVMHSTDGITWTAALASATNIWSSVVYGAGRFVAVALNGTDRVMYSTDAVTWTPATSSEQNPWQAITYGNGNFLAVSSEGNNRVMFASTPLLVESVTPARNVASVSVSSNIELTFSVPLDQTTVNANNVKVRGQQNGAIAGTWNVAGAKATFDPTDNLPSGEVIHVEVSAAIKGEDGETPDAFAFSFTVAPTTSVGSVLGENWKSLISSENNTWNSVSYGNGRYVAVSSDGTNRVMYSDDGETWTAVSVASTLWNAVTYGNGRFVAISKSGANRVMYSSDGISWTQVAAAEANAWESITFGNGKFVAVSSTGTNRVMYSTNGESWTAASAAQANAWQSVTYGNGRFVAVSAAGTNRVMYSDDAVTWTIATSPSVQWNSVTYGNGVFVAVSLNGTNRAMYSSDGITWTGVAVPEANTWQDVTFGNGRFVAVSSDGTNRVMYSVDGISWTSAEAARAVIWSSIVYGNGSFVAVAQSGSNRVMSTFTPFSVVSTIPSANAKTIDVSSTIEVAFSENVNETSINATNIIVRGQQSGSISGTWSVNGEKAIFDPSENLTAGEVIHVEISDSVKASGGVNASNYAFSFTITPSDNETLGLNWKSSPAVGTVNWTSVAFGIPEGTDGRFVAISTSSLKVMYSNDGITWIETTAANVNPWRSVTYGNGRFVAVSQNSADAVMYSTDGINWILVSAVVPGQSNWTSVAFGKGLFVAVSTSGFAMYSENGGETWATATVPEANNWARITYGNGRFIAVGSSGTNRVMYSDDGKTWFSSTSTELNVWKSVVYGNGKFVAVASSGTNRVMHSVDGQTWTAASASEANSWETITYGNGKFIALSSSGTNRIMVSENAETWSSINATGAYFWYSIAFGKGKFVGVPFGTNEVMYTYIPFTVNTVSPAANASSITANSNIEVTFIRDLNASTVTTSNIVVRGQQSGNIAGEWSVSGAVATFNPTNDFTAGEVIHVEVSQNVEDADGEKARRKAYSFTVASDVTETFGLNWKGATAAEASSWVSIAFGNTEAAGGRFVAIANNGTNRVMYSNDGVIWNAATVENRNWISVTYGNSGAGVGRFVAVANSGQIMYSDDGITWTLGQVANLKFWQSVTYGNGYFVAITSQDQNSLNRVVYSADGVSWTDAGPNEDNFWSSITYGNGRFVAVANTGTNRVMYSEDALNWTAIEAAEANNWTSITYGNGKFVAVASSGTNRVMYSTDGVTWSKTKSTESNAWFSVSYGNGRYVALAISGTNRIMVSENAETWTSVAATEVNQWYSSAYGNGKFVAVSSGGTKRVMYTVPPPFEVTAVSPSRNASSIGKDSNIELTFEVDLNANTVNTTNIVVRGQQSGAIAGTWSVSGAIATFNPNNDLTAGEVIHVEVSANVESSEGSNAQSDAYSFTITPANNIGMAENWTAASATEQNSWSTITYGNGKFVAVAQGGTNRVMYSNDGQTWTAASATEANSWTSITYGNGKFVAVAKNGTNQVMYSEDAQTWTASTAAELNSWQSVTFGNGLFVAVSASGTNRVMYSNDGATWTAASATEANNWYSVTYGNGKFVAVSQSGTNRVMFSEDGQTWTAANATEENFWSTVTYGNGKFVATAQSGTNRVMFSEDGQTWTAASATEENNWYSVTYGNGTFVAVTYSGTNRVMYSVDGATWTAASETEENAWFSVTYGNGKFVAVSTNGTNRVMYSESAGLNLVSSAPSNNATKVSLTDSLVFKFSEEITLVDAGLVSVTGPGTLSAAFVRVRGDSLIVGPSGLTNGNEYTVTIADGAVKNAADELNTSVSISFRTVLNPLSVTSILPEDGSEQIPTNTSISVRFDQAISLVNASSATIVMNGVSFSGNDVVLQGDSLIFPALSSLMIPDEGSLVNINLDAGAVKNEDDLQNERVNWSFRVFLSAPNVVSSSPSDNATKVALNDTLIIVYDKHLTLADASKIVVSEGENVLATTINVSSDSLFIVPSGMENGKTYSVVITEGALENAYQLAASTHQFSYRTIKTTPIVSNYLPVDGSVQITLDSNIGLEFDQAISLDVASSGRITVDGVTYDGLTVSVEGKGVVFPSLQDLGNTSVGKLVTVTLAQGAISNDDELTNQETSWTFTTFAPAPTLVSSTPANSATKVGLSETLKFKYDKNISLLDASKIVVNEGDNVLATTIRVSSDSLIIVPSGMENGITYTVTIGAGAIEDGNNQPNLGEEISFRVIQSKPVISQSYPIDGATGVEFTRPIALKVDQEVTVDAQTSAARISIDGTTYDGLSVVAQGDSLILPKLSSLGISTRGKVATITLYTNSAYNEDSLHVDEYSWSFTTILPQPSIVAVNPANGSNNIASTAPIWVSFDQSLSLVDTTKISISPAVSSWSADMRNDTLWIAHAAFANLTSYTIQVDSGAVVNTDNLSPSSKSWSFVTIVSAPVAPELVSPDSALINQLLSTNTFDWTAPQNAENYTFQLSDASDFSHLIEDESALTQTSFTSSEMLAHFTTYFWRVKAANTAGESAWSVVYSFTTIPEKPSQVFPLMTQSEVSTAPLIRWNTSPAAENLRVQFRFGTDTTMATVLKDTLTHQSNFQFFGLQANTRYFWSVRVQDDRGTSARSDVRSFLTRQDPVVAEDKDVDVSFNFGETSGSPSAPGEAGQKTVPKQTDYRMISLPGTDQIRLEAFFATEYKKTWRAFIETGDPLNFYDEFSPTDDRFRFTPGLGFWVLSTEIVADVRKFTPVQTNTNDAYAVAVHSGWNIIGNPYQSNIDWELTLDFNTKRSGKTISGDLWGYEKAFVKTDTLKPLKGYYFYNDPAWTLDTLYLPYTGFDQRGQDGNVAKQIPAETPVITATARYEDGTSLDVNWVFARSSELDLDIIRRHPTLDFVQKGMILTDKTNKSLGYVQQESELLEDGSSYELELKARRGSSLLWKASMQNLSSDIKLLLINKVTKQSYLVGNEEQIKLTITEPTSRFDVFIGSETYLTDVKESLLPGEFSLLPNYPNPFNPSTVIRYGLQEAGAVKLEVFDILGRKVQTLVNKEQQAGWHVVDFNASLLSSGVYLYRLQQGNHVQVQKMTLVK